MMYMVFALSFPYNFYKQIRQLTESIPHWSYHPQLGFQIPIWEKYT
jgi:hypothetical protein